MGVRTPRRYRACPGRIGAAGGRPAGAQSAPAVFHERPWSLRRDGSCPRPFSSEGCRRGSAPRTEPLWDKDGGRKTLIRHGIVTPSPCGGRLSAGSARAPSSFVGVRICPLFRRPCLYVGRVFPPVFIRRMPERGSAPQDRTPLGQGRGRRPSSVTAYAVTPSPCGGRLWRLEAAYGPFGLCVGARIVRPPFSTSGPGLYVETGLAPARFHPKDAQKGFRPAGQNPSGTGMGVERPSSVTAYADTFPLWGKAFGRLEAAPTGSPSVFA